MRATHVTDKQMQMLLIGGGVLLVGGVVYVHWQAGRAVRAVSTGAKKAADAVNPVNEQNIFNSGFNSLFQAVSGSENDTLGTWLHRRLNPDEQQFNTTVARGGI